MNFVYICKNGPNEELKYSIRSVLRHFPDSDVLVVGGAPEWFAGDHIAVEDFGNKFDNINNCYKEICKIKSFNSFVLMNDDFFMLKNPEVFEYFYDGTISKKIDKHTSKYGISKYSRVLSQANKFLIKQGFSDPLNYDVHTPMMFDIDRLSEIIDLSNAPRSIYGNIFNVGGIQIKDVKIYKDTKDIDLSGSYISTEDNSFRLIHNSLVEMYPEKSKYEIN